MTHGFRPIVAVDVFQQADAAGERITLGLSVVSPSWPHPPDCRCVCEVAGTMTARGVFWVAANWQAQISLTRRKATR